MAKWLTELGKVVRTAIMYAPKVIGLIKEAKDLFSNNKADIDNVAKETYKKGAQNPEENMGVIHALNELKNNVQDRASKIKNEITYFLVNHIKSLKDILEQGQIPTYNIDYAMRESERVIGQIFSTHITQYFSIGNDRFVKILQIPCEEERKEALEHFCNKVLINALKEIVNELDKSLAYMQETFCDILQDKYQIQQSLLQRDAALLRELQSSTIQEKQKKQIAIAEQIACYNAISLILQRLVK